MAYTVLRNNRRATKTTFDTYEAARQFIRKQIRKMGREAYITEMYLLDGGRGSLNSFRDYIHECIATEKWDNISRNPTNFTGLGYAIRALQ